ncbi:MAG: hypothetical protein AAGC64_03595 [Bacteroidota bacterium]
MSYTNRSDLANKNGTLAKIRCYDQGRIAQSGQTGAMVFLSVKNETRLI